MRILILGAGGMLGHKLCQVYRDRFDTWATLRGSTAAFARYKLIAPEGWLAQLLGGSLNYLSAIALALVGVGMFAWFAQDQVAQTRRDKVGDWWVYLFAIAGVAYAWQFFLRGTL